MINHSALARVALFCVVLAGLPSLGKAEPVDVDMRSILFKIQIVQNSCKRRCKDHFVNVNKMVSVALHYQGARNPTGFHGNWCGAFMAKIAHQAGYKVPRNPNLAHEWQNAGTRINAPRAGAIAVQRNHVSLIVDAHHAISGNYSRKVSIHAIPRHAIFIIPRRA